jgi:outer membrane biosynthesis protein TonB
MSRRSSRASFTLSWPFIIFCIIGYNVLFDDEESDKKSTESVDQETPAIVQSTDEKPNTIDSTIDRIKKEINTSVVIQQAKEEFGNLKDEVLSELNSEKKPQEKDDPIEKPKPEEKQEPVMTAESEKQPEPESNLDKVEETNNLNPEDSMKSL